MFIERLLKNFTLCFIGFLVACTTPLKINNDAEALYWNKTQPRLEAINTWRIEGRLKLKQDNDSNVVSVVWTKENNTQHIALLAPLGQTVLKLTITPNTTRIQLADGRVFFDNNPQKLIKGLTNLDVPIEQLKLWVFGKTKINAKNGFDSAGRLLTSSLAGWALDISEYVDVSSVKHGAMELPARVAISNNSSSLLLIIKQWNIDSTTELFIFDDDELSTIPVFK